MPLSDEEQRILQDIERSFYETDPRFADAVGFAAPYRHAGRNCMLAASAFVACLVLLLASFMFLPVLAFVAFLGMVASAFVFVRNVRRIGAVGVRDAAESARARTLASSIEEAKSRWRDQFRRQ